MPLPCRQEPDVICVVERIASDDRQGCRALVPGPALQRLPLCAVWAVVVTRGSLITAATLAGAHPEMSSNQDRTYGSPRPCRPSLRRQKRTHMCVGSQVTLGSIPPCGVAFAAARPFVWFIRACRPFLFFFRQRVRAHTGFFGGSGAEAVSNVAVINRLSAAAPRRAQENKSSPTIHRGDESQTLSCFHPLDRPASRSHCRLRVAWRSSSEASQESRQMAAAAGSSACCTPAVSCVCAALLVSFRRGWSRSRQTFFFHPRNRSSTRDAIHITAMQTERIPLPGEEVG